MQEPRMAATKYHPDRFALETPPPVKHQTAVSTHSTAPLGRASDIRTPASCKSEGGKENEGITWSAGVCIGVNLARVFREALIFEYLTLIRTHTLPLPTPVPYPWS